MCLWSDSAQAFAPQAAHVHIAELEADADELRGRAQSCYAEAQEAKRQLEELQGYVAQLETQVGGAGSFLLVSHSHSLPAAVGIP